MYIQYAVLFILKKNEFVDGPLLTIICSVLVHCLMSPDIIYFFVEINLNPHVPLNIAFFLGMAVLRKYLMVGKLIRSNGVMVCVQSLSWRWGMC